MSQQRTGPVTLTEQEANLFRAILRAWAGSDLDLFERWWRRLEDEAIFQAAHDRLVGDEWAASLAREDQAHDALSDTRRAR